MEMEPKSQSWPFLRDSECKASRCLSATDCSPVSLSEHAPSEVAEYFASWLEVTTSTTCMSLRAATIVAILAVNDRKVWIKSFSHTENAWHREKGTGTAPSCCTGPKTFYPESQEWLTGFIDKINVTVFFCGTLWTFDELWMETDNSVCLCVCLFIVNYKSHWRKSDKRAMKWDMENPCLHLLHY